MLSAKGTDDFFISDMHPLYLVTCFVAHTSSTTWKNKAAEDMIVSPALSGKQFSHLTVRSSSGSHLQKVFAKFRQLSPVRNQHNSVIVDESLSFGFAFTQSTWSTISCTKWVIQFLVIRIYAYAHEHISFLTHPTLVSSLYSGQLFANHIFSPGNHWHSTMEDLFTFTRILYQYIIYYIVFIWIILLSSFIKIHKITCEIWGSSMELQIPITFSCLSMLFFWFDS